MTMVVDLRHRAGQSSGFSERRDQIARRFKTFWPTSLRTADEVCRAHVLDISCTGAKIHAQRPIDANQRLEIAIGSVWHGASVRWWRGQTFGIAFDVAISAETLEGELSAHL